MREIKFRAKRADTGEWVYGDLTHVQKICTPEEAKETGRCSKSVVRVGNYDVDESTIGQYTGVTDRDGKEIYEGDVMVHRDKKGEIYKFPVVYKDAAFQFQNGTYFIPIKYHDIGKYSIVGNIYDNNKKQK